MSTWEYLVVSSYRPPPDSDEKSLGWGENEGLLWGGKHPAVPSGVVEAASKNDILSAIGADGWELVAVTPTELQPFKHPAWGPTTVASIVEYCFKRPND